MGNCGKEKGKKNAHRPPVETVRELQKVKSSHLLHILNNKNNSTTDIRPAYGKPVEWNVLSRLAT